MLEGEEEIHEADQDAAADGNDARWIEISSPAAAGYDLSAFPDEDRVSWKDYEAAKQRDFAEAMAADPNQTQYQFSVWRTVGIWIAGLFTLAIFSFLYTDNP